MLTVLRADTRYSHGSAIELTESQERVLKAFRDHGDMDDFQLGYAYRLTHGELDQSWSGLRTRRSELVKLGVIACIRTKLNDRNRKIAVWGISDGVVIYGE